MPFSPFASSRPQLERPLIPTRPCYNGILGCSQLLALLRHLLHRRRAHVDRLPQSAERVLQTLLRLVLRADRFVYLLHQLPRPVGLPRDDQILDPPLVVPAYEPRIVQIAQLSKQTRGVRSSRAIARP